MIRKLFLIIALIPLAAAADTRERAANPTSVIEDSMCIPALNGEGFLHVDEDVSGLVIEVIGADGQQVALYDAATAIEDVTSPGTGTYSAPSASNVRVSPDGGGLDCTEMQFANAVYDSQQWVTIRVGDGQTTIMDFARLVFMNRPSQTDFETYVANALSTANIADDSKIDAAVVTINNNTNSEAASISSGVGDVETKVDTAQADLDILTGSDGATLATSQPNYAPATAAALSTAQGDLDDLTAAMLGTFLNCEVNTANFAGDASNFACILTDLGGSPVTQATGDLEGLQIVVTSGAEIREARFINDTTWDGANSELQLQLSRALPGTLADAVTVIIR